jgi:hypothetical protein
MKQNLINPTGHLAGIHQAAHLGRRSRIAKAILSAAAIALSANLASAQYIGPSTTTDPYLLPTHGDVKTASILTAGDKIDGYRMVGIPDGLGAFNLGRKHFKLMMNHEIPATSGIVREHGSKGSFVSEWMITRRSLEVVAGQDHTPAASDVYTWDTVLKNWKAGTTAWNRFCSADLPAVSALFYRELGDEHQEKGKESDRRQTFGTKDRIFLNGEETTGGRAFAHIVSGPHEGESWELPRMGKMSFENLVASPHAQLKTIVMLLEDGNLSTAPVATNNPSNLNIYIGAKQSSGNPIERAGLTNGKFYGVKLIGPNNTLLTGEDNDLALGNATTGKLLSARFALNEIGPNGDVSGMTQSQIETESVNENVFRFMRIEDGAWDPKHKNDFYFVTTARIDLRSRLWRLRFDDIERPELGGKIENLLFGDEGQKMFDNIAVDTHGRIILQEDVGNDPRNGRVWLYGIGTGNLVEIARHNPAFFDPANPDQSRFITQDEESSGVIDAENILGRGWFLLDVQNHKASTDAELFEGGQLLAMYVHPSIEAAHQRDHDEDWDRDDDHEEDDD